MKNREKTIDRILDLDGVITKAPYTRKILFSVAAAIILFTGGCLLPLDRYGVGTGKALGFFLALLVFLIVQPWPQLPTTMFVPVLGMFLGFWKWSDFQAAAGSSMFLQFVAMVIVAAGAETTPIGKRIALIFLEKLGDRPVRLIVTVGFVTGLISTFVSNTATLIMMSGIANSLLLTMKEVPGKSVIGRIMMIVIPMASLVGGMTLISSAPGGNAYGIGLLEAASGGAASITYAQWAVMGVPSFLVVCIPMSLIYVWSYHLKNKDFEDKLPPKAYYRGLLEELGPMGGSELRWIGIVVLMIAVLIAGGNGTAVPLLFAAISVLPVIGTVPVKEVFQHVPMQVAFAILFLSSIGSLFSNTGLGNMFTSVLAPMLSGLGPYWFSVVTCFLMAVLCNVCVNGAMAIMPLIIGIATPLCISLGYNPTVVMFPAICAGSFFFWIMINSIMIINKGYGWWDDKDSLKPGFLLIVLLSIVIPAICQIAAPLFGMPVIA